VPGFSSGCGVTPGVTDVERFRCGGDGVAGGEGGVGLFVEGAGEEGDGDARDELAEEDYAAFAGAVAFGAGDIEAEVDFFEAGVEGDGEAFDADAVEEEADEGDVAFVLVEVEFEAGWEIWGEDRGINGVLGHDEFSPGCSKEGAGHWVDCSGAGPVSGVLRRDV